MGVYKIVLRCSFLSVHSQVMHHFGLLSNFNAGAETQN
jgi:hypothetical protein